MLRASIDIGSNSILLLIADLEGDRVRTVHEEFHAPRLGRGLASSGRLSAEAMDQAEGDLRKALEACRRYGVEDVVAAGTAALREAENSAVFSGRIRDRLGIEIRILSSVEEARLTFYGAVSDLDGPGRVAVLDVGGGSTECAIGFRGRAVEAMSVPVGAVKLSDRFGRSPGLENTARLWLEEMLMPVASAARDHLLVGVGGSITTLAAVKLGLLRYNAEEISACSLTVSDLDGLIEKFRSLSIEKIKAIPGMEPSRADIIEAGATIVRAFVSISGRREIRASARGLRHGLLLDRS